MTTWRGHIVLSTILANNCICCWYPTPFEEWGHSGRPLPPEAEHLPKVWIKGAVVARSHFMDGGMAEDYGVPEAGQLSRAWTRGRRETESPKSERRKESVAGQRRMRWEMSCDIYLHLSEEMTWWHRNIKELSCPKGFCDILPWRLTLL